MMSQNTHEGEWDRVVFIQIDKFTKLLGMFACVYFWSIAFIFSDFAFQKVLKTNTWSLHNSFHNRLVTITESWLMVVMCPALCYVIPLQQHVCHCEKGSALLLATTLVIIQSNLSNSYIHWTMYISSPYQWGYENSMRITVIIDVDDVAINVVVYGISTRTKTKYRLTRWLRSEYTVGTSYQRNHVRFRSWNGIIVYLC